MEEMVCSIKICNQRHSEYEVAIGDGQPVQLGLLAGVNSVADQPREMQRISVALAYGATLITDLSTTGTNDLRYRLLEVTAGKAVVGTVPTYNVYKAYTSGVRCLEEVVLNTLRRDAEDGMDFVCLHASISRDMLPALARNSRTMPTASRGGAMILEMMQKTGCENPFYALRDEILDLCRHYGITVSLINSMRSGCIADALDPWFHMELERQCDLASQGRAGGTQTMIELLNHIPLGQIPGAINLARRAAPGVPLGALGPSPTDRALGYDDIAGAIGAAVSAEAGINWINVVTAAEHVASPSVSETARAFRMVRLATYIGDTRDSTKGALEQEMARARSRNDWRAMAEVSLFPDEAETIIKDAGNRFGKGCTICGKACPLVRVNGLTKGISECPRDLLV